MPNPVQIHLALVHLPIAGVFFAVLCLILGEVTRVRWLWLAGGLLLVFAGLGAAGAYLTGEGAEDVMGAAANANEDAFSDAPAWVHRHENLAQYAFIVAGVTGLGGLVLMFLTRQKFGPKPDWKPRVAVLILALGSLVLTVATAATGGDIRHSEIRQGPLEPEKK